MKKTKQGAVITADVGASKVKFAVVNLKQELTEYLNIPPVSLVGLELDNNKFLDIITDGIKKCSATLAGEEDFPLAISIGSPGPLDSLGGVILNPPNLKGVRNLAITAELKNIFDLPIFLLNDADASLLGELWFREYKKLKNVVYITLSSGVGSGVLKDGQLETGSELGHKPLSGMSEERVCSCGEMNHAEAYLGTKGLAETYAKIFGLQFGQMKPEDRHEVSPNMRKGVANNKKKWLELEIEYSKHLALFLKNIAVQKPELIILGGGIIFGNQSLLAKTKEELKKLMPNEAVNIELAESGHNVNLGAAKYALEQLGL